MGLTPHQLAADDHGHEILGSRNWVRVNLRSVPILVKDAVVFFFGVSVLTQPFSESADLLTTGKFASIHVDVVVIVDIHLNGGNAKLTEYVKLPWRQR